MYLTKILVPALDHPAGTDHALEGLAARPGRVELAAVGQPAGVLGGDQGAFDHGLAVAFLDLGDVQFLSHGHFLAADFEAALFSGMHGFGKSGGDVVLAHRPPDAADHLHDGCRLQSSRASPACNPTISPNGCETRLAEQLHDLLAGEVLGLIGEAVPARALVDVAVHRVLPVFACEQADRPQEQADQDPESRRQAKLAPPSVA